MYRLRRKTRNGSGPYSHLKQSSTIVFPNTGPAVRYEKLLK